MPLQFLVAGFGSFCQPLLDGTDLFVLETVSPYPAAVEHGQGGNGLDPFVRLAGRLCDALPHQGERAADQYGKQQRRMQDFPCSGLIPSADGLGQQDVGPQRKAYQQRDQQEITGMSLPTAAMASAPTNFPKMSTSVALTSCSQIMVKATGRAKRKSLPASGPFRKLSVMDLHLADEQSSLGIHFIINGAGLRIQAADGLHIGLIQLEIEYIQVLLHSFFMDGFGDDHDAPL